MNRDWTTMLLAVAGVLLTAGCSKEAGAGKEKAAPNDDPRAASMVAALTAATTKFPQALCTVNFTPPLDASYRPYGHLRGAGAGVRYVCLPEVPGTVLDQCVAELKKQEGVKFDTERPHCFGGLSVQLTHERGDDGPAKAVSFPCGEMKKVSLRSIEDMEPTTAKVKYSYEPDEKLQRRIRGLATACKETGGLATAGGEAMLLKSGDSWSVLGAK